MKVVFNPYDSTSNKYVKMIINLLKEKGFEVYDLKDVIKKPKLFLKIKIIHLNWFESLDGNSNFSIIISFLKQYLKILIFKLFDKKILWTMHNKSPHEKSYSLLKKIILKKVIDSSNGIIIHCTDSKSILINQFGVKANKIYYCPHPNYIKEYGNVIVNKKKDNKLKLLFLGLIKPYKNIELLIDVIDELKELNIELKILGKPVNETYGRFLKNYKSENKRIKFKLGFVDDEEIPKHLSECDLLVSPLNIESSLNSGIAILAFSYKKSIICPEIGTINDLPNKNLVYSYSYKSDIEHKKKLKNIIIKAYDERKDNIVKFGENLFDYIDKENSSEKISSKLDHIYKKVM